MLFELVNRSHEFLSQPWPWYVAGPLIALTMSLLLYFGGELGISSNLRTICTIGGAGKFSEFFKTDWKNQIWNLVFVLGTMTGGFIAANWLAGPEGNFSNISSATVQDMHALGIDIRQDFVPIVPDFFNWQSLKSWVLLLSGGFMVGFGSRYAGGCTSGHVISGLSNLQLPSIIAVTGFFIGGLVMTYVLFPLIF